ncbi:MAG: hypothetical protein ACREMU_04580 [Gemmatimonadaceae bacterium]
MLGVTNHQESIVLHLQSRLLPLVCAMVAAACSKSNAASAPTRDASAPASSAVDASVTDEARALDCKKVFAPSDVAGIFVASATVSTDTQIYKGACLFDTPKGANINVSVGSDASAQYYWHDITATTDSKHYTALSGVGDAAFWWEAGSATAYVYAKKGNQYCRVELGITGGAEQTTPSVHGIELAKRLGALCTKGFAAT